MIHKKMKKLFLILVLIILIVIAKFGFQPLTISIDAQKALIEKVGVYSNEVRRLPDGTFLVAVRTFMPDVKAEMVKWWFSDYLQTTEQYRKWHPKDHVWMDWENKEKGRIIGASHLVHEYIGGDLLKLRIQFVSPTELFGYDPNNKNTFVICARVGLIDEEINQAKMCHIVRDIEDGAEMRSRFWLGHIAKRKENEIIPSFVGFVGNTFLVRLLLLNENDADNLREHAKEEMEYLGNLLPTIYQ